MAETLSKSTTKCSSNSRLTQATFPLSFPSSFGRTDALQMPADRRSESYTGQSDSADMVTSAFCSSLSTILMRLLGGPRLKRSSTCAVYPTKIIFCNLRALDSITYKDSHQLSSLRPPARRKSMTTPPSKVKPCAAYAVRSIPWVNGNCHRRTCTRWLSPSTVSSTLNSAWASSTKSSEEAFASCSGASPLFWPAACKCSAKGAPLKF